MEGEPPLQQVCSLNMRARALGVVHGMTQVEVDTFPSVAVLSRSPGEETAAKAVLLECAGAFSPRVEDRSEDSAFLCVIDIAGTGKLFGPPEALARNLLDRAQSTWHHGLLLPSAAIFMPRSLWPKDCLHELAVRVVPAGEEGAALASLPLSVLDLTEEQAETFSLWGIRTLGMLAASA